VSRRGHIYRRGESWTYVLDISLPGQRRRQKSKGGYRTKRDALAALNEAQAALQLGLYVEPSKLSVKAFLLDHWLPAIKSGVRKSTFEGYRSAIRGYVLPRLGQTRLQALTPDQLNGFYGELLREGRRSHSGGLSPKTVHNVHVMLHKALHDAVRWNYLPRNVAEFADPPRQTSSGKVMRTWTPEELRRFFDFVEHDPYYAFGGKTSTSTGGACRSARRSSRSTTASRSRSRRRRAVVAAWRSTAEPSRLCGRTVPRRTT